MIEIDPLAAIIRHALDDGDLSALVEGRVAEKHKYGLPSGGWTRPQKAVVIRPDPGGVPDLDGLMHVGRYEARCYGERPAEAMRVYLALLNLCQNTTRAVVSTGGGNALIYWVVADSSPASLIDPDVEVDMQLVYIRAAVSQQAVP